MNSQHPVLSEITLSVNEVAKCLLDLDVTKAYGPDGITSTLLKECANELAPSLSKLFNMSLSSACIPSEWKKANITPIHKKDLKEPASNYRPISLLCLVSKVLERCILKRLHDHVKENITQLQCGFTPKRSCVSQLLTVFHSIGKNLDKNIQTDAIYLDFAKALDSVDHSILLHKLLKFGVTGQLHKWFKDYLHGRMQRVVIDGCTSRWAPVTSGVPQGSLLGPMLFILFINDLTDVIPTGTCAALYPDDTKIYKSISSKDDAEALQRALTNLEQWCLDNNMKFNTSKCKYLTITRKKSPLHFDYKLNGTSLERVTEEKDLGVLITSKLTWNPHVHLVSAKANRLLGLLRRTCPLLTDTNIRRTLYLSLVKPQMCYATEVWSPGHISLKQKAEKVQRRATRWILQTYYGEIPYKDRLIKLNLLPLC